MTTSWSDLLVIHRNKSESWQEMSGSRRAAQVKCVLCSYADLDHLGVFVLVEKGIGL